MKSEEGDGVRIFSAAALADGPVGVDLEHEGRSFSRTGRERIVSRILHGSERDQVGLELVFWCAKESLAKALGTGLVAPLEQYETQMLGLETSISGHFRLGFRHFPGWEAQVFRFSGWILSVCLPQE
jgi:phosphopantetheinyl transferase